MIKLQKVEINKFRRFCDIGFSVGSKLTVVSGHNGVGKSNLISLISSGSGVNKTGILGAKLQPEFGDYFYVDPSEGYEKYDLYLYYREQNSNETILKHLTFKNDTNFQRGIRIIPRTSNRDRQDITLRELEKHIKEKFGIGGAARVNLPTIFLSMSRLYPLGEQKENVKITNIRRDNKIYEQEVHKKYQQWYSSVIPGLIEDGAQLSKVEKEGGLRSSFHMDMKDIPTLSQSVGQDSVGNIISAFIDIFLLSKNPEYAGAIIVVDEIDVSLHPDTQIKLLDLMCLLSGELNIQFVISSHSLTVLKYVMKKQRKDPAEYQVVYLKNPSCPMVMHHKSYELLKADMFDTLEFRSTKQKIYFEDDAGYFVFKLLIRAFVLQLKRLENSSVTIIESKKEQILDLGKFVSSLESNSKYIVSHIGCEALIKFAEADNYFSTVLFVLDGDARFPSGKNQPCVREYLDVKFNIKSVGDRKTSENIAYLVGPFAPESFLYRIINDVAINQLDNLRFWRGINENIDTALYSPDNVLRQFSSLDKKTFNNDDLKKYSRMLI